MRDLDFPPDEGIPEVCPDDPEEQLLYLKRLRGLYQKETAALDPNELMERVNHTLHLCPELRIRDPRDVLRFLALVIIILPAQGSHFLETVLQSVLDATDDWSATKRLDFIFKHLVGRRPPASEPDFGPWYEKDRPRPI